MDGIIRNLDTSFASDPDFGAIFLNYFGYMCEKNLEICFEKISSNDLYINFMTMLVMDKKKINEKKFADIQTKVYFLFHKSY